MYVTNADNPSLDSHWKDQINWEASVANGLIGNNN